MKEEDVLFKAMYRKISGAGSYYDGLKVGKPGEFDVDIVIRLPVNYKEITVSYVILLCMIFENQFKELLFSWPFVQDQFLLFGMKVFTVYSLLAALWYSWYVPKADLIAYITCFRGCLYVSEREKVPIPWDLVLQLYKVLLQYNGTYLSQIAQVTSQMTVILVTLWDMTSVS